MSSSKVLNISQNIARVHNNSDIYIFNYWDQVISKGFNGVCRCALKKKLATSYRWISSRRLSNTYKEISSSRDLKIVQTISRVKNNSDILIFNYWDQGIFNGVNGVCRCALNKNFVTSHRWISSRSLSKTYR